MARTGPFFTEKARHAAAEARRRRAAIKADTYNEIEVFAVRVSNHFSWEIRRFGGLELSAGEATFVSAATARAAGKAALALYHINGRSVADGITGADMEVR